MATQDEAGSEDAGGTGPRPIEAVLVGEAGVVGPDGRPVRIGGHQPQLVLAYLLIEGRVVTREELADLLWGDDVPDHWAGAVRGVLSKVRAGLQRAGHDGSALVVEGGTVRLEAVEVVTDVELATADLEEAASLVERATTSSPPDAAMIDDAVVRARAAGRRLAGPFLAAGDGDWVRRQQERVAELIRRATALEAEALLLAGRADDAAACAAARVAEDPFDERAHHLRIEALLAAGRASAAVLAYEQLAEVLRTELGIAPAAETSALVASVAPAPEVAPDPPAAVPASDPGPRVAAASRPAWEVGSGPFVGRAAELDELAAAWAGVRDGGRPAVVVIGGHAGLGKSRLAAELCSRLADQATVLWGRCRPSSGVPFEPVVESLHPHLGDALLRDLGADADGLVTLVPELRHRLPASVAPDDAALARAQMQRSVVAAFDRLASSPVVWVVDDLQWASADTLALLEVVLGTVARPVLVVLTYRGTVPEVEAALARVQRVVPAATLALRGLDEVDVAALLTGLPSADGRTGDGSLARILHDRTNGHPFLVTEIIGDARRRGAAVDPEGIPHAARDWITRRLAELPPEAAAILQLASVVGLEVDLDLLARCRADPEDEVLDRCEALVAVGLLEEADRPGSFAFGHRITHEVVYGALGASRRAVLHRTVGDALRSLPARPGRHRDVAEHYLRAGPALLPLALEHLIEAGREALGQSSWGLAASLFGDAVESSRRTPDLPERARILADALVGVGQARHRGGDRAGARTALEEAVAVARAEHLPVELAEAALLLVGRAGRGAGEGMTDDEQAALLREALAGLDALDGAAVPDEVAARRAALELQLEGELALALLFTDAVAERERLTTRAVERVRRAPEVVPANLARALLNARVAKLDPSQAQERLADLDEVLALRPQALSPEQLVAAVTYRHEELLRLGRRSDAAAALERARALADRDRHPYWRWAVRTWEGLAHLIDGDLEAAEAVALDAAALQVDAPEESVACLGVNLVSIRLLQGRADAVVDLMADAADRYPHIPCYRAVLALCRAEAGDRAGAESAYRFFADDGFATIPPDTNRFLTLAVLAHVAADLDDREGGGRLEPLLAPYGSLHVVLNCYGGGGTYWGPASHPLARLAALAGRADDAAAGFAAAGTAADQVGAPLHSARIRRHAGLLVA